MKVSCVDARRPAEALPPSIMTLVNEVAGHPPPLNFPIFFVVVCLHVCVCACVRLLVDEA